MWDLFCDAMGILMYSRKFPPGKKIFATCSRWLHVNLYPTNCLSCVNDCVEDMVTFATLSKIISVV